MVSDSDKMLQMFRGTMHNADVSRYIVQAEPELPPLIRIDNIRCRN